MVEEVKGPDDRWVLVDTHVVRYGSSLAVPLTRELRRAGYAPGDPIVIAMPKAGYRVRSVSMYVMDKEAEGKKDIEDKIWWAEHTMKLEEEKE